MILFPPAKINIGLQIVRKREDGFHDISTLMYLLPFCDILEINKSDNNRGIEFSMSGIEIPGSIESNLCYRAWRLFAEVYREVSVKIHLHKNIPAGAGLGGGSSNGAAVLRGLNTLFDNPLSEEKLFAAASKLGSDCSLFIAGKSSFAEGKGEKLSNSAIDLTGYYMVLLNPGIPVNTAWAYSQADPDPQVNNLQTMLKNPVKSWKKLISNDFERIVFEVHPEISQLKNELYNTGAIYASMSGSGSSVYGIYSKKPVPSPITEKYVIWSGLL